MQLSLIYLLIINAAGFLCMLADKYRARKNLWRIPERMLIAIAVLGGSIGVLLGMYMVRHKTKHPRFTIGVPLILALQTVACLCIFLAFQRGL